MFASKVGTENTHRPASAMSTFGRTAIGPRPQTSSGSTRRPLAAHRPRLPAGNRLDERFEQEAGWMPASTLARDFTHIPVFAAGEHRADRASERIVRIPHPVAEEVFATPAHPDLRREPPRIAHSPGQSNGGRDAAPPSVGQVLASPGRSLEPSLQRGMERRLGHDFSRVRIHTDLKAAKSAHAVRARAYTVGHHIVFADGQYDPGVAHGRTLLAHELTHTIQQSANSPCAVRQLQAISVEPPGTSFEQAAEERSTRRSNSSRGLAQIHRMALQRQAEPPSKTEEAEGSGGEPLFTLFVADESKRRDARFARRRAQADAARIKQSGTLSSEDRRLVNATLRFLEGDAWKAYGQAIKPALLEVTREEIEMPADLEKTPQSERASVQAQKQRELEEYADTVNNDPQWTIKGGVCRTPYGAHMWRQMQHYYQNTDNVEGSAFFTSQIFRDWCWGGFLPIMAQFDKDPIGTYSQFRWLTLNLNEAAHARAKLVASLLVSMIPSGQRGDLSPSESPVVPPTRRFSPRPVLSGHSPEFDLPATVPPAEEQTPATAPGSAPPATPPKSPIGLVKGGGTGTGAPTGLLRDADALSRGVNAKATHPLLKDATPANTNELPAPPQAAAAKVTVTAPHNLPHPKNLEPSRPAVAPSPQAEPARMAKPPSKAGADQGEAKTSGADELRGAEHTSGTRASTKDEHQAGQATKKKQQSEADERARAAKLAGQETVRNRALEEIRSAVRNLPDRNRAFYTNQQKPFTARLRALIKDLSEQNSPVFVEELADQSGLTMGDVIEHLAQHGLLSQ